MNAENLIPSITSMGGGFFIGVMLGYFVKKIIKVFMFVIGGILKQRLTGLWKGALRVNSTCRLDEIVNHDDIKQIFAKALHSKRPVHLLLVGSPG
jgi:uncharacterized membrane protein (Fun14 family)